MEEEARGRTEVDPPALALASPVAAAARKTVRMSAARDVIIPDYTTTAADDDQGSFAFIAEEEEEGSGSAAGSSVSAEAFAAAAAAVRGALYRHGSDAGSPPPLGVPCEGAMQDTPDYIRRSAARHRGVAPLELFSAAASSPRPGGGSCAAAEAVVTVAAAGTEGQTTVGGVLVVRAILQPKEEEVESGSCSQLRQQYACCGHASIWLGSSVILFEHDFSCPVMLLGVYPFYVRYHYRLLSGPESTSVFEKNSAWHISEDLDIQAMKKACSILVGHHDFSSFRAAGCQANSPMRTLDELTVTEVFPFMFFPSKIERSEMESSDGSLVYSRTPALEPSQKESDGSCTSSEKSESENGKEFGSRLRHRCFVVTARARSFLYHQVRLMVGLLKSVGTGEITTEDVERILNAKRVTAAPPMAPACGLYLANVKYDLNA